MKPDNSPYEECWNCERTIDDTEEPCECHKCDWCEEEVGFDNIIIHTDGITGLCEKCSLQEGQPHCRRDDKDCQWCQEEWLIIEEEEAKKKEMDNKWRENEAKSIRKCDCDCCSDSRSGGTEPVPTDCELYKDIANGLC